MGLSIILHADDFGMNPSVTDGILQGFAHGLLTSTAVMSNAPDASRALTEWQRLLRRQACEPLPNTSLRAGLDGPATPWDLGVHLNLTEGRPLTGDKYPLALLDAKGRFPGIFHLFARLSLGAARYRAAIRAELAAQIAFVTARGLPPTHLNGHQYVELLPAVADLLPELAVEFAIPVLRVAIEPSLALSTLWPRPRLAAWLLARIKRHYAVRLRAALAGRAIAAPRRYFGTAHAGLVDRRVIKSFLSSAGDTGVVEIGLHPGQADGNSERYAADGWRDPLALQRPRELDLLTSTALADLLRRQGVRLGRLSDLVRHRVSAQPARMAA